MTFLPLAQTLSRRGSKLFGMKEKDRLLHMFIAGQTGTGKSTLLRNMILEDIRAGRGLCLIDPHGDLANDIYRRNIEKGNFLYWNVADPTSPYGYNPLTYVREQHRSLVVSGLIETLKKQWEDAWGVRMEHLLRYALLALLERAGSTLEDIMPLFLRKEFRGEVVANIKDRHVQNFWKVEFPAMNYRTAIDGVAPIANKLGAFLSHPTVRKAVCSPDIPMRFRSQMDEGQILLVNLGKGRLGADTANVLGGLIVGSIARAAYSREGVPEKDRRPYFLYLDEFHSFTTSAFVDMLSELRKYGLGLIASTQFLGRIKDDVHDALFGNVGTIFAFRVGSDDAALLSRQFGYDLPRPQDLIRLPNYECYVSLMVDGTRTMPFSARTFPVPLDSSPTASTENLVSSA